MPASSMQPCELLEWDSSFFGFRIGRVIGNSLTREHIEQIDTWCQENSISCLYFLACADEPVTTRLAEVHGFRLVDIRTTLSLRAGQTPPRRPNHGFVIRSACCEDVPVLEGLARESHHDTRFFYDGNFPSRLCEALYAKWIARSCEGYADTVLVAEAASVPVGYVACHLDDEHRTGRIGLLGVDSRLQCKGIGELLVLSALEWFLARGVQEVRVVTQGRNCAAQRLYQRCGFSTQAVELWYHKWYKSQEIARD